MQNQVVADCVYKDPEINVSFFGLNSAWFSDYPTITVIVTSAAWRVAVNNVQNVVTGTSCEVFSYLTLIIEIQGKGCRSAHQSWIDGLLS